MRVREAEKTIESSRSVILRLLGEASTIRNQIAQADTYLAGIERERTRVQKEEEAAAAEIERLAGVKEAAFRTHRAAPARNAERDDGPSPDGRRPRGEAQSRGRAAPADRPAARRMFAPARQTRVARKHPFAPQLHDGIDQETARRARERARRRVPPRRRAGRFHRSGSRVGTGGGRISPRRTRIRGGAGLDAGRAEHEPAARANWKAGRHSLWKAARLRQNRRLRRGSICPASSDQINFTNGLSGQTRNLLPRLSGCYLASDREQARAMAEAYPDRYFLLADGQCYNGRMLTGGRKKASGPLVLKRELREFAAQLQEQERALAGKVARSGSAAARDHGARSGTRTASATAAVERKGSRFARSRSAPRGRRDPSRQLAHFRSASGTGTPEARRRARARKAHAESRRSRSRKTPSAPSANRLSKPCAISWMPRSRKRSGSAKNIPCCARNWRRSKSGIAASARLWRRLENQYREMSNRRQQITRRSGALG